MQIGITQQEIDKGVTFQEAITKVKLTTWDISFTL